MKLIVMTAVVVLSWPPGEAATCRAATVVFFQRAASKQHVATLIEKGVAALDRNETEVAKGFFSSALQADPGNELAHTYLGIIADRAGDLAEAERHFRSAATRSPGSPAAHNNYGVILVRLGKANQAASHFETSLRLNPAQAGALVNLAQIRFSAGTPEGLRAARELFERARKIAPDAEIARALVVTSLRLNDRKAAGDYYQKYQQQINAAPENIRSTAMRAELGTALLAARLLREANSELEAVVASDPTNVDHIILLARSYQAMSDIKSAGRTLESVVARGIDAAPIYAALAEVYEVAGHVENAIPAMRLAIQRDPRNESYRFRYGMLLTDTRAPEAAVIRLNEAIKEFPQSPKLLFALGIAHFKNKKHEQAAIAFRKAVQLDPKFASALAYLGLTYEETGNSAEAIALYNRALAADEKLAAAHYLVANALLRDPNGNLTVAEKHLLRAIEIDPTFSPGRLALARVYMRTERFDQAAPQLEAVVAAEPNLTEALYQLSRVYVRLKRKEDADKTLAAFKRLSDKEKDQELTERKDLVRRLANVSF
ncbi:MAG TPA: tetratricopeptide repeat protein [Pyrinomonadaceae bacterium]|nr:tetratricopeptide repeat protein [Pyrinomonadaceae bacterium]